MSTPVRTAEQTPAAPNQNLKDHWAEIEYEITEALGRSEITKEAVKYLKVQVGGTGVVLSGEVFFDWERDLAVLVAKAHAHCMGVLNRIQIWGQTRAPGVRTSRINEG